MRNKFTPFIFLGILLSFPITSFTQVLFESGQSLSTGGSHFEVVAVGDVNNDGLDDVVAGTSFYFDEEFDYTLQVYLQSPSGTLPTTQYYSYAKDYPGLRTIDIDDVNNDSLNDIVIGYGDSIAIFFQNTSGTLDPWVSYFSGTGIQDLQIADINNDTLNDIVTVHSESSYIRAFYQVQDGFTTSVYAKPPSGNDELEIGDVNADGLNDVVFMAGAFDGGIHVFAQNAAGTLNNYVSYFPGGDSPFNLGGIAIGDLNNDGHLDVAASKGGNRPYASLVIWYQDTITNLLQEAIITPAYEIPSAIEIADFNCDGGSEIYMTHGGWDAITVWFQDASGQYTDYDLYSVSVAQHPSAKGITSGDINNDGKLDIVAVGNFTTIQLLYNTSIPSTFTDIDTLIVKDTLTDYTSYDYYLTTENTDTIDNYLITQIDSFLVTFTIRRDSAKTDSIITRYGILCDSIYSDVMIASTYSVNETENKDTSFWSTTVDTVIISDIQTPVGTSIKIFPNPFDTHLHVQVSSNEDSFISIYDFLGRHIFSALFSKTFKINTTAFTPGIYFYKVQQEKAVMKTGTVIKH